jgi:hypothetical protein
LFTEGQIMEVRIGSKTGSEVPLPSQLLDRLAEQLHSDQKQWLQQLTQEPGRFADLEVAVHQTFQQMAAQLVASLLAQAMQQSAALEAAKKK